MVVLIGLDRWPRAIDRPRVLDEEFSLFETDGSRGVRARCLLDAKGRQTLPNLGRSRCPERGQSSSFDLMPPEFGNLRAVSKTHIADASPGLGATADIALVGEFLGGAVGHYDEGNDEARKGGRGQAPRPSQGRRQWRGSTARPTPRGKEGTSRHRSEGIIPLTPPRDPLVWSSGGWTGGQRRRGQSPRGSSSLAATEDKNQCLRADVQQRVILAAMRWVDADSAVDERKALATLLKGCTGYALGVSSNVGSYEYSRVSLPESVVDAPPLVEMLPAEARFFLEFQSRMLLPSLVTAVIQEVGGEPGCHNDPRLLRSARSCARFLRQTPFFVKKENRIRLTVDCRKAKPLFAPPPSVELLSGDGLLSYRSRLFRFSSWRVPWPALRVR